MWVSYTVIVHLGSRHCVHVYIHTYKDILRATARTDLTQERTRT